MSGRERQILLLPITMIGFLGAFLVILGLVVWEWVSTQEKVLFDYAWFFDFWHSFSDLVQFSRLADKSFSTSL
jgi:hypothetical protein